MISNWKEIALKVGSLNSDGSETGGDSYGKAALEEILGEEWIQSTVNHIISFKPGSEIATDCLRLIHSSKAAIYAYNLYKLSDGDKADRAVWLIKQLAHPIAIQWMEEFLIDVNVIGSALGVLDQLLWTEQIQYDENIETLFQLALLNSNGQLKSQVDFIREYLQKRTNV